jgi:8-oxo-dGTP pyrophosphatase MutT (NUDIX family)
VGKSTKEKVTRAFSAGGVVFKKAGKNLTWLIIQPSGTSRWQFPKGLIDSGENSEATAVREVEEEGGVKAKVIDKIGTSQFFFVLHGKKIFKTVTYYLMGYLEDVSRGHDGEVEKAIFVPFDEALEKLTFKDDKETLKKAGNLV